MQVIFDNGGGITLQNAEFAHYYQDAKQAAQDALSLLDSGTTRGWEGNEPEARIEVDAETERNGGYLVYDTDDIRAVIKAGEIEASWHNVREFFAALGVKLTEE